jgi:raffinose/stachyose/melibiose transport system permease protein
MAANASTMAAPYRRRISWTTPFTYGVALAVAGVSIGPVIYAVLGGFRNNAQINSHPAGLPSPWIWSTYGNVLTKATFWHAAWNSTVIALIATAGVTAMGVCAAFVLSRYTFRGREGLYTYFVIGLLFPAAAGTLPLFLLLRTIHLTDTWWGVILPQIAFGLPITIVILRPFLAAIPGELEDASAIDGASKLGFFVRVLLPLAKPALVTVAVLAFVGSWNSFTLPLVVLQDQSLHTLPIAVQEATRSQYTQDTSAILAFTSLAMLPSLLFFTLAERQIVGGFQGAVKG